jgi:hypothetical protein
MAVRKGIHVLELGNLILVCIREEMHTGGPAIVDGKDVKGDCENHVHGLPESHHESRRLDK